MNSAYTDRCQSNLSPLHPEMHTIPNIVKYKNFSISLEIDTIPSPNIKSIYLCTNFPLTTPHSTPLLLTAN